ncbi:hypothetical protein PMAYCL1PPCAC_04987, partial [Pristionchus mayeri]
GVYSSEVEVCGLLWKLLLVKRSSSPYLEVYLLSRTYDPGPWSIDVSAEFRLILTDEYRHLQREIKETFCHRHTRWGIPEFIPWNELEGFGRMVQLKFDSTSLTLSES